MGRGLALAAVARTIRRKIGRRICARGNIEFDVTREVEGIGNRKRVCALRSRSVLFGEGGRRVYCRVERLKIVCGCIVASVLYGIVHDQFTARICVEYFTVFHPPVFATQSPTLLGIGWGIIATWWAGAIIGLLLSTAARSGARNKLTARQLAPSVAYLMIAMAFCAVLFGTIGYFRGAVPADVQELLPRELYRRFLADWWAHSASYAGGFLGGLILCVIVLIKRFRVPPVASSS